MMSSSLGFGTDGLAGALAAHELGLKPVVLEKAAALGGGTVHSYGLIWVGQNYFSAGIADSHDEGTHLSAVSQWRCCRRGSAGPPKTPPAQARNLTLLAPLTR